MQTEVLIVGAGPTGLALACQLQRFGIDFLIIDRNSGTTPHSKAIGVQARTLEIYEQIGLAKDLVGMGTIAKRARMLEGGKIRGEVDLSGIGEGMSPYPFLLLVEQGKHEKLLFDHISGNGSGVEWSTELAGFEQNDAGVKATVRTADGIALDVSAKYLVGCDGAGSEVRKGLGLEFSGSTIERLFYVADVEIDWDFSHDSLYVALAANTITAFFPMTGSDRHFRIVGIFPEGHEGGPEDIEYDEIEKKIIEDTELDLDITGMNWFSVYKVHSRHAEKFSLGRCFLAGDSAHIHTPAGAQGMNTGIQDGYNLAWKLAAVLRYGSSGEILASYNDERLENAKRLLRSTDRFFQFGSSPNPFVSFLRTKIVPYVANGLVNVDAIQRTIFSTVSQIGIRYRQSFLSKGGEGFSVKAGDRMPWFEVDGRSIYERLHEPKFHHLIFDDGRGEAPASEAHPFADVHRMPLYPHIAEIFGTSESFQVLLRPDNHIGLIEAGVSADRVKEYMARVLA